MRVDIVTTGMAAGGGEDVIALAYSSVSDLRPALRAVAEAYRSRERGVFATAHGGAWAALSRSTVRQKGNARVLVDTGDLLRSLTVAGAPASVERVDAGHLTVGTTNLSAHWADIGFHGPARPPSPQHTEAEIALYADVILGYIMNASAGAAPARGMVDLGTALPAPPARAAIGA